MSRLPVRKLTTRLGREVVLTEFGFGTAPLGNLYRPIDERTAQATLQAAWNAGCRYFDAAPLYGHGVAEMRLNHFLRGRPRQDYALSTKVGRLLKLARGTLPPRTRYFDTPAREVVFDYGYNGIMRSVEDSLERLGADRFDILYVHDLGADTHGTREAANARLREFLDGGFRALDKLRQEGVVTAIGAGCNEWEVCEALARAADVDVFLLAGRYTLLEQTALETFLPLCQAKGIGVVVGGPFNSGILVGGTTYNYRPAPAEIVQRVERLRKVCAAHGVEMAAAALAFPLAHPVVVAVIPGGVTPAEVQHNVRMLETRLPAGLWADLRNEGLLRADAPVPE